MSILGALGGITIDYRMSFKKPFQKKHTHTQRKTNKTPPKTNTCLKTARRSQFVSSKKSVSSTNKKTTSTGGIQSADQIIIIDHPTIIQKTTKHLLFFARRLDRSLFRSWLVLFTKEIPWTIPSRRSEATRRRDTEICFDGVGWLVGWGEAGHGFWGEDYVVLEMGLYIFVVCVLMWLGEG